MRDWFASIWPVVIRLIAEQAINLIFTAALIVVAVGFWLAWEPLGLIVPGGIVLAITVWARSRDVEVAESEEGDS